MTEKYDHRNIEKKWQAEWEKAGLYRADENSAKPKKYILDMFPYPSGEGLHVGHPKGYIATDVYARMKRMQGFNVLHAMGWDAFGLPAEQYAIKNKVHPRVAVDKNVARYKEQLSSIGFDYDWSREVNTTDPEFYKWTQWIFLKMFEKGLAFESSEPINWCPTCLTGLANEDLDGDKCERCDTTIEQKPMRQWVLRITDYADRMLADLDKLDWPASIKESQRNWIGRSEGAEIDFPIVSKKKKVIIIHGFDGDPSQGWKPWLKISLEMAGLEVRAPKLPNTKHPDFEETMAFLKKEITDFDENDILVGHSLGAHFALKLAEDKKFGKVIIVAPAIGGFEYPFDDWKKSDPEDDYDACQRVLDNNPVNFLNVQAKEKVAIFGTKDGVIPIGHAEQLDDNWKVVRVNGADHMSHDESVLEILESVMPSMRVFTTRPDTLFGATYCVLAPEHKLLDELKDSIANWNEVEKYREEAKARTDIERSAEGREKTGVKLEGVFVVNPANDEELPVFVADYVLGHYGTGAVMAVPAHDVRDFEFAKKYDLPIKQVIEPILVQTTGSATFRENEPVQQSNGIIAIVKHWSENKYLGLRWPSAGWGTFLTGGIDDGFTPEQTALKEIREETGYRNAVIVRSLGVIHSKYYHEPKKLNRFGHAPTFYIELENGEQDDVSAEEISKHETVWLTKDELKTFLTAESHQQALKLLEATLYTGGGILTNSNIFDGLTNETAKRKITDFVKGRWVTKYRLKDWVFSRQRYWGEPIPLIHCDNCGVVPVPEKDLPVMLPEVQSYEPTGTGESPLANVAEWVNTPCPKCGGVGKRETNTMPQWAGSSWYYLRFIDSHNTQTLVDKEKEKYWSPVDMYVGGAEHATRHLIYARFYHKFLFDIGSVNYEEPFMRLQNVGLIMAEDGRKMSKRWGNVVNPDDIVAEHGADTLRLYEMFMGPFGQGVAWSTQSIIGPRRFLERVWKLKGKVGSKDEGLESAVHKTIKKVSDDIESFGFNTAISTLMILVNEMESASAILREHYEVLLKLLAPFAPHITEELWHELGNTDSIHLAEWPVFEASKCIANEITIAIQVGGKLRDTIVVPADADEDTIKELALARPDVLKWVDVNKVRKIIFVPGKLINIVI